MLRGSLNRTTRDVGARKNRNTLCSSRCYTRKRKTLQLLPFLLLLFSFLTRLPSLSLSLFVSLSLFWLSSVYVNDPNSTVCSRVDCSSSNAPDNVFLLLRGIHSRCARSRPGPTIIAEAWQGFSFFRDEKDLRK